MKVTFVEPKADFGGYDFWLSALPSIGVLYLATILDKGGHDVEILSDSIKPINGHSIDADVLCVSTMSSTAKRGYEIASKFKKSKPDARVIIGGTHASFMQEEASRYADHVVVGEGESVISGLVEGKIKEKIVHSQKTALDSLPFPNLSLIKNIKLPLPITPISTSRGCPFNCNFCSVTAMFGRQYRFRSPESVIGEVLRNKHKKIFFYDDNFCAMNSRTKDILKEMKKNKIYIPWISQSRVEIAKDDELMRLMAETNCNYLCLGFESINEKTLKAYNKSQELNSIKKCIKKLHDYGIKINGMFVFGSDHDDKHTIRDTVDFCNQMEIETPQFSILTPFPGSHTYNEMDAQKRIFTKDWKLYDGQHVVFKPKKMSAYELQLHAMEAVSGLYWITKRGAKFFFKNIFSSMQILSKCNKWKNQNNRYLDYLRKKIARFG